MHRAGHSILVDLSYASLGYCGIAQESRVVLKAFCELPGVTPTGLIFGHDDAVIDHRFAPSRRLARQMENQALYIQALIDRRPQLSLITPVRWLQRFRRMWRMALARHARTELLESDVFWDAVWRGLLARSLSDSDIEIARTCPMLLANLGGRMLTARSLFGLPAIRLDTSGYDFALFHNSQPIRVSPNTCKLVRYYDMIPGVRPDLVDAQADVANHFRGIRRCLKDSVFVCDSEPARADLLRAFPQLEERSTVVPAGLPDGYYPEHVPHLLPSIFRSRQARHEGIANGKRSRGPSRTPPYLLMTAAIEPRKNHVMLVRAFEALLSRHKTNLRLVIVGQPGWKYGEAMHAIRPLIEQQRIVHLVDVPSRELRVLNSHAEAVVFPSLYEGFGYGPLEAMACRTPALVSDIAAHRWTYGDACLYFDPYRVDSMVEALEGLLFSDSGACRQLLIEKGVARARLYSTEAVGEQWLALLDELRRQNIRHDASPARLARFS